MVVRGFVVWLAACAIPALWWGSVARAQLSFEDPPIDYRTRTPNDRVHQLKVALESDKVQLTWDAQHGWLPSLLTQLDVPMTSQTLVFSKTSQQIRRITPQRPRALYFNDDVYVGSVQQGDFVELSAVDPEQGAIFYKIDQRESPQPRIVRDQGECLSCHATSRTQRVPGYLVRSTFVQPSGHPEFRHGTTTVDHTTPFAKRFGGWYVTGHHGEMRHRGNAILQSDNPSDLDTSAGANLESIPKRVDTSAYLTDTSDIVALMVLEHQSQMHNWITRASYQTRQAIYQQRAMNQILGRDEDFKSESTKRRIESAGDDLVRYIFFCDEHQLTSPVEGNSTFAKEFVAIGPRDSQGRSLRDFDLRTRMFRFPCSYLVYTDSFLGLPKPAADYVHRRMIEILTAAETPPEFQHLTPTHRAAILAILNETHPLFR